MRLRLSKRNAQELINETVSEYKNHNVNFKLSKLRDSVALSVSGRKWSSWLSDWSDNTYRYYNVADDDVNELRDTNIFINEAKRFISDSNEEINEIVVENVCVADWSDSGDDIEVKALSNGKVQTFYVQLTDGQFRGDLGCWLMAEGDDGDIDYRNYPDFDLPLIENIAEQFYAGITKEVYTDYEIDGLPAYLLISDETTKVVTRNPHFINSVTSSYQREFSDPLRTFDTEKEAFEYLRQISLT